MFTRISKKIYDRIEKGDSGVLKDLIDFHFYAEKLYKNISQNLIPHIIRKVALIKNSSSVIKFLEEISDDQELLKVKGVEDLIQQCRSLIISSYLLSTIFGDKKRNEDIENKIAKLFSKDTEIKKQLEELKQREFRLRIAIETIKFMEQTGIREKTLVYTNYGEVKDYFSNKKIV